MSRKPGRRVFVQAGKPVGTIPRSDHRYRQENSSLVVLPDENWGNPVFGDACLAQSDFHVHARLTLDRLAGTGASELLGGHYHYSHSRPDGNMTFRISLDEDIAPARKSLGKKMYIVQGRVNPSQHWNQIDGSQHDKKTVGVSSDYFNPGEPFSIDIYYRDQTLSFQINGREVFKTRLDDDTRITPGRSGDTGWPISVGFMPGHGVLRIDEFYADGDCPGPIYPTTDTWLCNSMGYLHYRLPSVCVTPGGRLIAFADGRRAIPSRAWEWERDLVKDEYHCVMTTSDDDGRTWSPQRTILDRGVSFDPRDPAPLVDWDTGEVFLFTGQGPCMISSRDQGESWSEPLSLATAVPGGFRNLTSATGNSAIQLRRGPHKGRLLVSLFMKKVRNIIALIYSDDHGKTWHPGALTCISGAMEHSIVELSDGRVIVSPRIGPHVGERSPGRVFMESHDGGCTLGSPRIELQIPMPGQGGILGFDPPDEPVATTPRPIVFCYPADNKTNLTMVVSLDDGKTWPISRVIDTASAANLALVALPQRQVGVLYERDKYRRLSFQRVDLDTLINDRSLHADVKHSPKS